MNIEFLISSYLIGLFVDRVFQTDWQASNKSKWNTLIDDCFEGKIDTIVIAHKDRFVRFGFEWISDLLYRLTGTKILVAENIATSPEEELI